MSFYEEPDPYGDIAPAFKQEGHVKNVWSPGTGGCLNFATWRQNPQIVLSLGLESGDQNNSKCHVEFKLDRSDSSFKISMGVYIIPITQNTSLPLLSVEDAINKNSMAKVGFSVSNTAISELSLYPGEYVMIPCTYDVLQGEKELSFDLNVRSNTSSVALRPVPILENTLRCTGTWVKPEEVLNAQKARFSFSSDEDGWVRVWLCPANRSTNPQPQLHLWKFKLLEPLEIHRSMGETFAEFFVSSNTPYYLAASSSQSDALGNFHFMVLSEHPLDFGETHIAALPSVANLGSQRGSTLTLSRLHTNQSNHHISNPNPTYRSDSDTSVGRNPSNGSLTSATSDAKMVALGAISSSCRFSSECIQLDEDGMMPPPPPHEDMDPFFPLVVAQPATIPGILLSKQESLNPTPPSAPNSPMFRGHIIESYSPAISHNKTTPVMQSGLPSSNIISSIPTIGTQSAPSPPSKVNLSQKAPHHIGIYPIMAQKFGNQHVEPIPMLSLSSRPSSGEILDSNAIKNSTMTNDSHAMEFSMQSCSEVDSVAHSFVSETDSRQLIPEDSLSFTIRFSWAKETAGGNARCPTWRQNQQWLLEVTKPDQLSFTLTQLGHQPPVSVGVYILRAATNGPLRRIQIEDEEHRMTAFDDDPKYVVRLNLPIGRYIVIPCTEYAGIEREAILSIKSSVPVELSVQVLHDTWSCLSEDGEWTAESSGGCWTEQSWLQNPQYLLRFKRRSQVTIVLSVSQQLKSPIGFYVIANRNPTFKTVLEVTPDNLMFPVQFRQRKEIVKTIQGSDGEIFNIVPATFLANQDFGAFSLMIFTSEAGLVSLEPVNQFVEHITWEGHWMPTIAGGCLDHASWRGNAQLKLTFPWSDNIQIGFSLTQSERPIEGESKVGSDVRAMINDAISASKAKEAMKSKEDQESSNSSSSGVLDRNDSTSDLSQTKSQKSNAAVSGSMYGVEEADTSETFEPFGFCVYPVEDHRVKRVLLDRNELLIPASFATARRASDVLSAVSVQNSILGADNYGQLVISPFHVNQYVNRPTNYELRVIVQYDTALSERMTGSPESPSPPISSTLSSIPYLRASFSHRGEWTDPLANIVSIPEEISSPRDVEAVKLARAEVRKFHVPEANTMLVVLLIQKSLCLGEIQVYKLGPQQTFSNKVKKSSKEDDLILLLNKSTLVHHSVLSRSKEIFLKCVLAEPGYYAIAAVPEVPESVGPVLLVTHYWKPIIDLNIDKTSAAEKQAKRTQVISEILSTETSYVKNLKVLVHHFMTTLVARAPELGVDVEDVKKIFSNIPTLLNCNTAFWEQLKMTINAGENMIGRVFGEFCNYFRMYADYTNHFDVNCKLLEELKKKSAFKEAMNVLENHANANRLHFRDYYITPVQRIPRYALLLEQLLKYTDEKHSDYQNLIQSLDRVKSVAFDINEKKRRADAESQVMAVQSTLFYKKTKDNPLIAVPARLFIRSGMATLIAVGPGDARAPPSSSKKKKVSLVVDVPTIEQAFETDHLFLFNDTLILAQLKRASKKYYWMHQISLTNESDVSSYKDTMICLRAFVTTSAIATYWLEFPSQSVRNLWMSELTVLIQVLINQMHLKLASKVQASSKILDSKMQVLLPS